jgi:hypothetical protein
MPPASLVLNFHSLPLKATKYRIIAQIPHPYCFFTIAIIARINDKGKNKKRAM